MNVIFIFGIFCIINDNLGFVWMATTESPKINLKPSIHFNDLELKLLCEPRELRKQFSKKLRTKWTKCLGLGRIYFPYGKNIAKSHSGGRRRGRYHRTSLDENTWKRLRLYLTTSDDTMNVYCRLSSNWKPCSYHLRQIHCLQSNYDSIQMAKNPKYSPLYHNINRQRTQSLQQKLNSKKHLINQAEREDNIENMFELYKIRCENIRMSAHYMNGGGGGGGCRGESTLFNRYNQHLFQDYHYPQDDDEDDYDYDDDRDYKRQEL
ncbi:hypothetical protein DERP_005994 [Dermatophagoides pteronyssinus]|uniref:Uncharacterized protein n=1 Tax=Dermatophagoides pteronyssinus TaxID=6956 RepID=A0ABQ8JS66_DERPT|nr:hypothetical protein DERP_005994 [Dermatophagoides pteronyssinus]